MRRYIAFVVLCVVAASAAGAQLDADQNARYYNLVNQLRCLICQNRSIADSDAPLAADLRHIVARQIASGRSDTQIKQYLVDRYGQWVLYDPPFQFSTWLLWLGPFVLLVVGLGIAVTVMRRRAISPQRAERPELDRARLEAILAASSQPPEADGQDRS